MNTMDHVLRRTIQGAGIFQVILGIIFWTGTALQLIPVHMLVGITFVIAIWLLALRAVLLGAGAAFPSFVAAYGVLVIAFGMTQAQILPGQNHWIIRVLHLAVGFGAMGMADGLWRRMIRRARPARALEAA